MNSFTDEQIVASYATNRNGDSFELLYRRYYSKVVKKCIFYTKDSALSQDLAQDIFIKLFEKLSSFRAESKFSTWLNRVIYHHCVDYLHQKKFRYETNLDNEKTEFAYDDNLAEVADFRRQKFYNALHQLDEEDQKLLRLKYLEDVSIYDLSVLHGLTQSAVKMRLLRSRERLRKNYLSDNTFF